jgi:hypothetical protein
MKKVSLLIVMIITVCLSFAAIDDFYSFNATTGTYTPITGTALPTVSADDALSDAIPLGFSFPYGDNVYTDVKVSSNGWVGIGTAQTGSNLSNSLISTTINPVIAPLWDDLSMSDGNVQYLMSGTAPNRVFTVQYTDAKWNYSGTNQFNFQARLYETGKIDIIYGSSVGTPNNPSASIGINMAPGGAGWFYSVNFEGTASTTSETSSLNNLPTQGTVYEFNPAIAVANDLAALAIMGNVTPSVGTLSTYTATIRNRGTDPQTTYTVKLFSGADVELASVNGTAIQPNEILDFDLNWTPTAEGPTSLYAKVVLAGDQDPTNDQSSPINVTVMPAGVTVVTIGDGDQNARMPFDFFYMNSLHQALYFANEIGGAGSINALSLFNNFNTNLTGAPIKVWMGTTTLTDLSADWIPSTQMTLVFDGNIDIPAGENNVMIPLMAPFNYTGDNLVIMFNRPMDTQYYSSSDYFKCQTVGTNRARNMFSDGTEYDPAAPTGGTVTGQHAKIALYMGTTATEPIFAVTPQAHDFGAVMVDDTMTQSFNVSNVGAGTLGINTITIAGSPMLTLAGLPTLPAALTAGQNVTFNVVYAPTAVGEHTATVTITDDQTRVAHTVTVSGSGYTEMEDLNPPTDLAASVQGSTVNLSWVAPGETPPPPPPGFSDGFETYTDFALTFDPWVLVDVDQSTTYGMTGITWPNAYAAMAYIIFNPSTATPAVTDAATHSGAKMAASFASTSAVNNDWMMSPLIAVENGDFLTFWAKSYVSTYGLERFKVGISTTGGTAPADFTIISGASYIQAPIAWTEYSYDLSAYAGQNVRFAIQCLSDDAFIFFVDDVAVGPLPVRTGVPAVATANVEGRALRGTGTPVPAPVVRTETREQLGYKVYRDGALIQTITNPATVAYADAGLDEGTYSYTVTATYTSGESIPAGPVDATITGFLPTVENLTASVEGNDVTLAWDNPEGPVTGEWLTWCEDILGNSIGTNAATTFDVAHRYTQADLTEYQGSTITQVKFVPAYQDCIYTIKIWTGGTSATNPGTLVATQVANNLVMDEWNLVVLNTPVPVPATGELWIGYGVDTQGGYPAGCDMGPAFDGFGNLMYFSGAWTTLLALAPTLNYNWLISGFAQDGADLKALTPQAIVEHREIRSDNAPLGVHFNALAQQRNLERIITGYKIYRDGVQIGQIMDPALTTYLDMDLPNGTYTYGVSAVHTVGESETVEVDAVVDVYVAPSFWEDGFETYENFALTFAPWTLNDVDQSGTYGFSGIEFPNSESAMAYIIFNPSATTPPMDTLIPHGGAKMAASFAAATAVNNDWMITPRIHLGTESAIKFYAKSHTAQYGLERMRVGVSTLTNPIPASFQYLTGPTYVEVPVNWTEYVFDLSAYDGQNVWIGIRCVSDDAFVFYVDDFSVHGMDGYVSNDENTTPAITTSLSGNYPNPFNPETTIRFSVAKAEPVTIEIYNVKGQLVRTLVNEVKAAGEHSVVWNGKDNRGSSASSGVYFYKMRAGKFSSSKKMILMK